MQQEANVGIPTMASVGKDRGATRTPRYSLGITSWFDHSGKLANSQ
jgi:hypothetical protein